MRGWAQPRNRLLEQVPPEPAIHSLTNSALCLIHMCVCVYYLRIYTYIHTTVQILIRLRRASSVSNTVRLWSDSDGSDRQGGKREAAGAITVMEPWDLTDMPRRRAELPPPPTLRAVCPFSSLSLSRSLSHTLSSSSSLQFLWWPASFSYLSIFASLSLRPTS